MVGKRPASLILVGLLMVLCALGSSAAIPAPPETQWASGLAAALAQAASEHKMILVDMVADWCGWCKIMEKETWQAPAVAAESAKYVLLRLDTEKNPDGVALARKLRVSSLPTVLLLDSSGEEFERLEGYLTAQEFVVKLREALADPQSLGNLRTAERRNPENLALRFQLGDRLLNRSLYSQAEEHFASIVKSDPTNHTKMADTSLFYLAVCKADRSDIPGCLTDIEHLRRDFPDSSVLPASYLLAGQVLIRAGRRSEAREQILEFLSKFPDHPLTPKARQLLAQADK